MKTRESTKRKSADIVVDPGKLRKIEAMHNSVVAMSSKCNLASLD